MKKIKLLTDLFFTFSRIGAFTFGGGYAMLPILQKEIVEKRNWATDRELADYYAIGQCTPGIIAVNTATFIGEKTCGKVGGVVATLGLIAPALILIQIIAAFIQNFSQLKIVGNAFAGIRVCVSILILKTVVSLYKKTIVDKTTLIIFLIVIFGSLFLKLSPIIFVIFAAIIGVFVKTK